MRCPTCGGKTKPTTTAAAQTRADGRVYRVRTCQEPGCGAHCSTLESYVRQEQADKAAQWQVPPGAAPATQWGVPVAIPTAGGGTLYDLEGGLEKGLQMAVDCIIDAVDVSKPAPDKGRIDAAKWLIDDRRKWRVQMAAQAVRDDTTPTDPAMAQLTQILKLLPDEASA